MCALAHKTWSQNISRKRLSVSLPPFPWARCWRLDRGVVILSVGVISRQRQHKIKCMFSDSDKIGLISEMNATVLFFTQSVLVVRYTGFIFWPRHIIILLLLSSIRQPIRRSFVCHNTSLLIRKFEDLLRF